MTPIQLSNTLKLSPDEVIARLDSSSQGLSKVEAKTRLKRYGENTIQRKKTNIPILLWRQIGGNPLVIILATATTISYIMGQKTSALYIFAMIILSAGLGFWNEFAAERTVAELLQRVSMAAITIRNNQKQTISVAELTYGDIVFLEPGSIVPADLRLLESDNLELDQSTLTGESKTVYKQSRALDRAPHGLNDYQNIAFMSTTVTSGSAKGIVVGTGKATEFGKIAHQASFVKPETDFQKGLSQFGGLIVRIIIILSVGIFAINAALGRSLIDSLLFALAIAVGLTPELLPIIVTISLSHGAGKLAKKRVICKQLIAIENLGNMDVLCTDKTGTLTNGQIVVTGTIDAVGKKNDQLIAYGAICNSATVHHRVLGNAIDVAIWHEANSRGIKTSPEPNKIFEEPFDYEQRKMFCVIEQDGRYILIAKGSPDKILSLCRQTEPVKKAASRAKKLNADGLRLVAIATKTVAKKSHYSWDDLKNIHYEGFITFLDTPKESAASSIKKMENQGVSLKIVTGDSDLVTKHICQQVGLSSGEIITGEELATLSKTQQIQAVQRATVFARVTPSQKLMVISLLREAGHTVGYMGDGINDIPALRSADVGISVNTAVDVAKDAAAVVLLRKGLDVISEGIDEGRRTFANTIKYILMGTSSNFGNMFSAAGASFFLPFLPMTPSQILLNNTLYDISQVSIPTDNVDAEVLRKPRHWDIKFIKYYMLFFGPISSVYDFLTFGMMLWVFHANAALFQTGWFVESLATQVLVIFIIRTVRQPFYKSRPSKWVIMTCLGVVAIGVLLPYMPFAHSLGFVPLPAPYFLGLFALVITYLAIVAWLRAKFLRRIQMA